MNAPIYNHDFFSDEIIQNPFEAYAEMRSLGPVVWLPQNECWAAVQYRPALEILRNARLFLSGHGLSLNDDVNKLLKGSTLNSDGERHKRQRALTATPIMAQNLESLEPAIMKAATRLAERLVAKGRFDGVQDFARILPLSIVTELVGLPDHGKAQMLDWAAATFNLFSNENKRTDSSMSKLQELVAFLDEYGHPEALEKGGLSHRIFEEAPKHGFSIEESVRLMRDYIAPSLDTTISVAANIAYLCAENPEEWTKLRQQPELIDNAIEEAVRLTTPIRAFSRYIAEDREFHGVHLKKGQRILVVYASANRDESIFKSPDRFDVSRKTHKHLGFGQGVHMCMGMHLARLELRALLLAMVKNVASWHLDGVPELVMNNTIHGFAKLPLRISCD